MGEIASLLPLLQGASSAAGAYGQYSASMAEGRYGRAVGNMNAQLALQQAEDANRVGEQEAAKRLRQGGQDASSERARYAAQGINVDTGSAAQTQEDVRKAAEQDAVTIRKNAAMQAWGFGMDAVNSRAKGNMAYRAGRNEGLSSLISGGLQFTRYATESYNAGQKPKAKDDDTVFVKPPSGKKMSDVRDR
jgi:hypothetical protein